MTNWKKKYNEPTRIPPSGFDLSAQRLLAKIPAWQDMAVRMAEVDMLLQHIKMVLGYTEEEIGMASDDRMLFAAYQSMKYEELKTKQTDESEFQHIAIKDVRSSTWDRFKGLAARDGLKHAQALDHAVDAWERETHAK